MDLKWYPGGIEEEVSPDLGHMGSAMDFLKSF